MAAILASAPAAGQSAVAPPAPIAVPPSRTPPPISTNRSSAVESIIVTANKRRERQRDVANSVTAITGRELDRRQIITIQDLASQVPGLSVQAVDKTEVRIVLRGLNAGSVGATVASVLDDVPTNVSAALNNGAINSPNYDSYDLQRIEVLRGPQGTLYGATAEGGLIKYVTNPPDLTAYSGALEGGIDGMTAGGIGGSLKGFANFPLLNGKAALRLTAWNDWLPGYIDNPERGKTDANSGQQYGWRASLLVQPTPELSVRLTAQRQTLFSNAVDELQVAGAAATPTAPPANQFSIINPLQNNTALPTNGQVETAVYNANVSYDFGFANLTSITAYSFDNFKNRFDLSNANLAPGVTYSDYLGAEVYGTAPLVGERQNTDSGKFSQELRLTSDPGFTLFGNRFEWLVGGFYTHETSALLQFADALDPARPNTVIDPALPAGGINLYDSLSEWAFFANVDYYFTPTIDLALGGRLSGNAQHSQANDVCCVFFGPTATAPEINSNDHYQLFSVAPRWRISDDTLLYARIASGYRPGGPNIPVQGFPQLPASFGPDRTVNYELGLRQDLFNKRVSIDVTGFYITWKDVQVLSLVNTASGPIGVNGNAGSAISKGVEWNLTWAPLTGLRLNATGSYQDSRISQNAPGLGAADGDFLPYVPSLTSSVNVDYGWTMLDRYRAYVSGTWTYTGQRYTDFVAPPSNQVTESHVALSGYHTGSIRTGIEDDRYGLELYLNNLSDTRGIATFASSGGAGQTGQETIIQPRTIGMLARVKF